MCDRIDEEYQKTIRECNDFIDLSIVLPFDADGVPIRVGDIMEFDEVGRVQHLEFWGDDSWVIVVEYESGHFTRWHPSSCHHYHKPTVEDVLGRGECYDIESSPIDFCCSECGMRMYTATIDTYTMIANDEETIIKHPNFCPNCGRKVMY